MTRLTARMELKKKERMSDCVQYTKVWSARPWTQGQTRAGVLWPATRPNVLVVSRRKWLRELPAGPVQQLTLGEARKPTVTTCIDGGSSGTL